MNLRDAATGERKPRLVGVRYEVHRLREDGKEGWKRPAIIESFSGLDRARIAALSHALDGPTVNGDRFTGLVEIYMVLDAPGREVVRRLVDAVDERVASRLLNEIELPQAHRLSISVAELQAHVDALTPA